MYVVFCVTVLLIQQYQKLKKNLNKTKIAFCNNSFIIVNKQPDLKINSNCKYEQTAQTFLKLHFPDLVNDKLYHQFYFPHRLDYATSGLLCVPKSKQSCTEISKALSDQRTQKYYIALVRGIVSFHIQDVNIPIGNDCREPDIQKMCTTHEGDYCIKSRKAQTIFTVIEEGVLSDGYPATKLLCRPLTGRRHQIRVHCSYLGHSIAGDYTYSNRKDVKPARMYLHAIRLVLPNVMDAFDVSTNDPFCDIKDWTSLNVIQSLNTAYKNLDDYVNNLYVGVERINQM